MARPTDGLPKLHEEDDQAETGPFEGTQFTERYAETPSLPAGAGEDSQTVPVPLRDSQSLSTGIPFLRVVEGNSAHRLFALTPGEHVIGRTSVCSVHLNRRGISRTHARIFRSGEDYVLEDLDSTNGTWVNGERVRGSVRLMAGDRIGIGQRVTLKFVVPDSPPSSSSYPTFSSEESTTTKPALSSLTNLTATQVLFWVGAKLHSEVPLETDSIRFAFTIRGPVDRRHFHRAVHKLVDQADALRMVIRDVDMVPKWIHEDRPAFAVEDVVFSAEPRPTAALASWLDGKRREKMSSEVPFGCALIQLGPDHFVWYVGLHHLTADLRSVVLISQLVAKYYELSVAGQLDAGAEPLPTYAEYCDYNRNQRTSDSSHEAADYWRRLVADMRKHRDPAWSSRRLMTPDNLRTAALSYQLSPEESRALKEVMKAARIFSPAIVFLTAFFACLASLDGGPTRPLAIGTTYANRSREFLNTIGLFVSTCPMQLRIDEGETFVSLARKVQAAAATGSSFQHDPPAHGKIYDAFFNYLTAQFGSFAGMPMQAERVRAGYSNTSFSLTVRSFDASDKFTIDFEMRIEKYTAERRQEAMSTYARLLRAFFADPNSSVVDIL